MSFLTGHFTFLLARLASILRGVRTGESFWATISKAVTIFSRKKKVEPTGCAVCAEKERLITTLADEVDWLRLQSGTPLLRRVEQPTEVSWEQPERLWVSDEEEDMRYLAAQQVISTEELERALEQLGAMNTHIEIG